MHELTVRDDYRQLVVGNNLLSPDIMVVPSAEFCGAELDQRNFDGKE